MNLINSAKLMSIDALAATLDGIRALNLKIVHSHGMFDRLHVGHFRHLRQAKQLGDILVVTIFPDSDTNSKNVHNSITENQRAEALSFLEWVDFVAIDREFSLEITLKKLRPDIFVSGRETLKDYRSIDQTETISEMLKRIGIKYTNTQDGPFQTKATPPNYMNDISEEIIHYLKLFKARHDAKEVFDIIDRMRSLRVFVIGDTILDEYYYCHTLGASSKDPTLAVHYTSHELFAGGILAIANHVANFCESVHLVTLIGDNKKDEEFIRSKLKANIDPYFIVKADAPTVLKRRIIEPYSLNKLLEIYIMDDSGPSAQQETDLRNYIKDQARKYNLVIAGDFGHGAITKKIRQTLIVESPFLCVNTQANAGNKRIHTISRYERADFVSIAEHELRLETRDLQGDVRPMIQRLRKKLKCKAFVVTRGKKGSCIAHSPGGSYSNVPSFARNVVDRVGAGDACFSISAMAAYLNAPAEVIAFLCNIVGAIAVGIIGNQRSVEVADVKGFIGRLLSK